MPMKVTLLCLLLLIGGAAQAAELSLAVSNASGAALENAVATLTPVGRASSPKPAKAVIDQINKEFVPYVSVVPVGSAVSFPNQDNIRHSVYSFSPAKKFELKLYSGTQAEPVVFDKAGVVALGCNIHDWMIAYVYVTEAPFYGRSDARGNIAFSGIEPGEYELRVWHPDSAAPEVVRPLRLGNEAQRLSQSLPAKARAAAGGSHSH
ncbi:methylamine utilization protein [Niveibacterium sp. 24ML]|uniref:methylamine utilization protein n=1 Tax=Niveibacterium sp. 24ML TaxID=2985512 RepID=UPI00226ED520|nr:methylamine utilization protein [Niveibacterium sp. 24ML]MCX9155043.1 methylamine utilization protein [Niveibacterium sp. 24ML]